MPKPTEDEVQKEVALLKEQLPKVRRYSAFGDDNRAQIIAQIRVAEEDFDDDDIEDFVDDAVQPAARDMRDWMDYGDTGDGSPSQGWALLFKA